MPAQIANYMPILKHQFGPHKSFRILHDPSEVWPWCIEYYGNGHYGLTVREVLQYANGRGWIEWPAIQTMAEQIEKILSFDGKSAAR